MHIIKERKKEKKKHLVQKQDYLFTRPSTAAAGGWPYLVLVLLACCKWEVLI